MSHSNYVRDEIDELWARYMGVPPAGAAPRPAANHRGEELLPVPLIPDNVLEARRQCVLTFIADVLLPRMENLKALTPLELQRQALEHQAAFRAVHPFDFDPAFEIIPAAEMALIRLCEQLNVRQGHSPEWKPLWELAERALAELKRLLDADEDFELYSV